MSQRIAIALWQDAQGLYHGLILGDPEYAIAMASTAPEVRKQLAELAIYLAESQPWRIDTQWQSADVIQVPVEARPRYQDGNRALPTGVVALRVPCVRLLDADGGKSCIQPQLQLNFSFDRDKDVRELVQHYASESMRAQSPTSLAESMPPAQLSVEFLSVALRQKSAQLPPEQRPELKVLFETAEPLLRDRKLVGAAFGRAALVLQLQARLAASRGNILLVGNKGVGKTTVLVEAARKHVRLQTAQSGPGPGQMQGGAGQGEDASLDSSLRDFRFWRASGARMIAGMRYLGQWEKRAEQMIYGLRQVSGYFAAESLLELVRTGGSGATDSVGAFLVPYLQRGDLRMIAEATEAEVQACRRLCPALLDCFEQLRVPPIAGAQALALLMEVAQAISSSGQGKLAPELPAQVLALHRRFLPGAVVPGPALAMTRKLAQQARHENVDRATLYQQFAAQTGLPEVLLRDDVALDFDAVSHALAAQIIGQPAAVAAGAQAIITLKAGMNDPARPIAVLLLAGPTGTGKTAFARALAAYCFGASGNSNQAAISSSAADDSSMQPSRLIRLDMSEYSHPDAHYRFLSSDESQSARWLQQIEQQPFSVVLFDEIEKASPDIFDLLLGLLDEGQLTDRYGRTFDFRSAIVLLSSNLGASARAAPGFIAAPSLATAESGAPSAPVSTAITQHFRPEFFNRLDAVVPFHALDASTMRKVAEKELRDLVSRDGLREYGLSLAWQEAVVDLLAARGFDPRFGARPMQRAVEQHVVQALAHWRLQNPRARDQRLTLTLDADGKVVATGE
jgi:ATP-dependent Clp protease ATP-binding subunit ClpC